jgi:hypothetical protein
MDKPGFRTRGPEERFRADGPKRPFVRADGPKRPFVRKDERSEGRPPAGRPSRDFRPGSKPDFKGSKPDFKGSRPPFKRDASKGDGPKRPFMRRDDGAPRGERPSGPSGGRPPKRPFRKRP